MPEKLKSKKDPGTSNNDVEGQIFLTTLIGSNLLLLNTILKPGEPSNTARDLLVKVMSTLQVSAKPIDIPALQESIRKTGKASLPGDSKNNDQNDSE